MWRNGKAWEKWEHSTFYGQDALLYRWGPMLSPLLLLTRMYKSDEVNVVRNCCHSSSDLRWMALLGLALVTLRTPANTHISEQSPNTSSLDAPEYSVGMKTLQHIVPSPSKLKWQRQRLTTSDGPFPTLTQMWQRASTDRTEPSTNLNVKSNLIMHSDKTTCTVYVNYTWQCPTYCK